MTNDEMAYEHIQELHDLFDMFDNERQEYVESLSEEERYKLAQRMIAVLKMVFGPCRVIVNDLPTPTVKIILDDVEEDT